MRAIFTLVTVLALGCVPRDIVPASPSHPAQPTAPEGRPPASTVAAPQRGDSTDTHAGHGAAPDHAQHADMPRGGRNDDTPARALELAAFERAKPVFDQYCASCHTSKGERASKQKLGHFNMDVYPFGGHHASEIGETIRKVLGVGGSKPSMPKDKPGVVKGEELERVVAWSKAFDSGSGQQGQHEGHDAGAHTHQH